MRTFVVNKTFGAHVPRAALDDGYQLHQCYWSDKTTQCFGSDLVLDYPKYLLVSSKLKEGYFEQL